MIKRLHLGTRIKKNLEDILLKATPKNVPVLKTELDRKSIKMRPGKRARISTFQQSLFAELYKNPPFQNRRT